MTGADPFSAADPTGAQIRIDRIVVETAHPVDAAALPDALGTALRTVISDRGLPRGWTATQHVPTLNLGRLAWDGRGGTPGLAEALVDQLYAAADTGVRP